MVKRIYFPLGIALVLILIFAFDKTPDYFIHENLEFKWETKDELKIPESVCFDERRNQLYISNINGNPTKKDGNGFISVVSMEGEISNLKWVTGMDAPKGMGIHDEKLFVTDVDRLHVIDISSGTIEETHKVEEAQFLNDISVLPTGDVYISDMQTDRIYHYKDGNLRLWLRSESLERINGLFATEEYLYVGMKDEVVRVNYNSLSINEFLRKTSSVDGLEQLEGDYFLFSDWEGRVYKGQTEAGITKLLDSRSVGKNAADIEYIPGRNLLFVPTFMGNTVTCFRLSKVP